jgi:hypothetical protein
MPATTADLQLPGRLLLWTLRHWARCQDRCADLPSFVRLTLDQLPGGRDLRDAAEVLIATLAQGARRPLCLAAPETGRLTHDETAFVLALEAARAGLSEEVRHALADLQHGGGLRCSAERIARLGALLDRHGLGVLRTDPGIRSCTDQGLSTPAPPIRPLRSVGPAPGTG